MLTSSCTWSAEFAIQAKNMRDFHALCTSGAGNLCTFLFAAVFLLSLPGSPAEHACEAEVASACPERPGSEIAACLKDKEQHDTPTELSSECTDFIALSTACADEIENLCDGAFFTDDTVVCLTQWVSDTQLSERCQGVLEWAVPKDEEEDGDGPTDELGMSEKDRQEKEEWRAKRRAARGDAIERMKMKEVDRKKEEDRVALEKFKEENPEEYAQMLQQQEEERRQQAEFKRKERQRQAAFERKRRQEQGIKDEEEEQPKQSNQGRRQQPSAPNPYQAGGNSTLMAFAALVFIALVCVGGYIAVKYLDDKGKKGKEKAPKKPKKK